MEVLENFKHNLRLLRASKSISGVELSQELNMPIKRINDLEEGRLPPKLDDLIKICSFYNISFDDILVRKITLKIGE
jgi:transcriptional regulator with XRE-family HTH domain